MDFLIAMTFRKEICDDEMFYGSLWFLTIQMAKMEYVKKVSSGFEYFLLTFACEAVLSL